MGKFKIGLNIKISDYIYIEAENYGEAEYIVLEKIKEIPYHTYEEDYEIEELIN